MKQPTRSRTVGRPLAAGLLACVLLLAGPSAAADEIDDAAARPFAEARPALGRLLEAARAREDVAAQRRIHTALAGVHLREGDAVGALPHLEAWARLTPADEALPRVRYAEVLLGIARQQIGGGALGRNVQPYLRDALTAVEGLDVEPDGGIAGPLRARLAHARAEAYFLLGELDDARATLQAADVASVPEDLRPWLSDLVARVRYAQGAWEDAAAAFTAAEQPLAAASAWDAARRPDRSMPIYAEAIRAAPGDAALLERALGAVRFHKSHAALLERLQGVEPPAGAEGVPFLRARAELLEGAGRPADALAPLKEAAARDPEDAAALVEWARLQGLLALSGDAVDDDRMDAAADAYIEASRRQPDSEGAAAGLSWVASQDYGRMWRAWTNERLTSRCLRVQEALCAAQPDDAWAWGNLGNTLRILGRTEASIEAYARAREANPYDPAILSDLGLALSGAGRIEEALEAFEASVELDPGHVSGHQNAARALYLRGEDEKAAAHLGAAIRTARAIGNSPGTYRFLLDRIWRAGRRSALR